MERGASATVEYSSLAKLEVLDFFGGDIARFDIALVDNFRSLNIASIAFRNQHVLSIESGAVSNLLQLLLIGADKKKSTLLY